MTRDELIAGLATLNAPNQGMNYHGGGLRQDGAKFDSQTGERLPPRYEHAKLTVYGDRARFLYRLITEAEAILAALQPQAKGGAQ